MERLEKLQVEAVKKKEITFPFFGITFGNILSFPSLILGDDEGKIVLLSTHTLEACLKPLIFSLYSF